MENANLEFKSTIAKFKDADVKWWQVQRDNSFKVY